MMKSKGNSKNRKLIRHKEVQRIRRGIARRKAVISNGTHECMICFEETSGHDVSWFVR